ncbi:helix-turn-helix transcriptional regulator [Chryseobacterium limigenitum]|uniref:Regulatory protein, luxR family n=1 Tax=Chryseobacterium limigenitum TaxID=1612149 RepID=A0A1K2IXE8_9FLAO|nr:hypothetical protein [Chryseobacterium limigenitum]SFZ96954.1 hypothetical protein SAMN05216324_13113 [Chryseobacterium limigenitum]
MNRKLLLKDNIINIYVLNTIIITCFILGFSECVYHFLIDRSAIMYFKIILSLFYGISFFLKIKTDKRFIFFIMTVTSISLTFFIAYTGTPKLLTELFYVPILFSLLFFFDISVRKELLAIFIIFLVSVVGYIINQITGYASPFENQVPCYKLKTIGLQTLQYLNIIRFSVLMMIIFYFIGVKFILLKVYHQSLKKYEKKIVENIYNETDYVSDEQLEELHVLTKKGTLIFSEKFRQYFPNFTKKIIEKSNNQFTQSEMDVCFLLKLNYSTKEIAALTNSTIRAIEAKKYRIRKKFNIPKECTISAFLAEL